MKTKNKIIGFLSAGLLITLVHFSFASISSTYGIFAKEIIDAVKSGGNILKSRGDSGELSDAKESHRSGLRNNSEELLTCANLSATHSVSGCFVKGSAQLAIVRFEVSWQNAIVSAVSGDTSDVIRVKIGDKTRIINPGKFPGGEVKSPYPVAFELPADGSTTSAQIFRGVDFSTASCAIEITGIVLPTSAGCGGSAGGGGGSGTPGPIANCEFGDLGGIVWFDDNQDGIYTTSETTGVGGALVEAYNISNVRIDSAVTDVNGRYALKNIDSSEYPVRLQFTKLPLGTILPYQSDVRFAYNQSCQMNFAVYKSQSSNTLDTTAIPFVTTCFVEGDQNSPANPHDVLVASTTNFDPPSVVANKTTVGSVWGLAYNPLKKTLFSAAFLKRHNGLGPLGLGGIYQTNMGNPAAPVSTPFIDLDNLGVNLGTLGSYGTKGGRKFNDRNSNGVFDPGEPSWDQETFAKVGKAGLGDIEISEDFNTLYTVNLFEKKIISIDITAFNNNGTLPTASNIATLPNYLPVSCGNGTSRPFALKVNKGKLYLGLVCDGFPAYAQVQSYEFATGTWTVELPLTNISYKRTPQAGDLGWPDGMFQSWVDTFSTTSVDQGGKLFKNAFFQNHSAILSDIEFDGTGNMILGFIDRGGHQLAADNYSPDTLNNKFYTIYSAGELLMAHKTSTGKYVVEFNPESSSTEFFKDGAFHPESSNGGLAYNPGNNSLIFSAMDPITFFSGGLIRLNATTGQRIGGYNKGGLTLYNGRSDAGYAGKGAGIGDVELLSTTSVPPRPFLQIGNFAWVDLDKDGIQDPNELSLPGLDVSLFKIVNGSPVFVAYTQTDASGAYAFTGLNAPNEYWVQTNGVDSLLPEMDYKIVFGYNGRDQSTQLQGMDIVVGGIPHKVTVANMGIGSSADMHDNDATLMTIAGGSYPSINVTTGTSTSINHSFDVGFTSDYYQGIGNFVWFDKNFDGEQNLGEQGVGGVKVNLHPCVDTLPGTVPGLAIDSFMRTTDEYGRYIMAKVPTGNYALSFNYSMLGGSDTLRFTLPDINFNNQKYSDSEVKIPSNYYAQLNPSKVAYTGCFHWKSEMNTAFDPTFDAGLISTDELIDPTGYVYCEGNGEILPGGLLTVTGPGNVYMIHNASEGYYQYYVDAVGVYTMTLTNPPGYVSSELCLAATDTLDAPQSVQINNPYSIGSDDLDKNGFLDDYTCPSNQLYYKMLLEPGDFIINNNFPMSCTDFGDLPSPYPTVYNDNGPRHAILRNPLVYMGSSVDIELNGQPEAMAGIMGGGDDGTSPMVDDEDGLVSPTVFVVTIANEVKVQVVNKTNQVAKLTAFADLNKDGDFNDAGEMQSQTVSAGYTGPVSVYFTPGLNAPIGEKVGLRLRFSTEVLMTPTAFAKDGEIEDYMVIIAGFDYGDLPESYNTSGNDNPPAHIVSESLKLGSSVDAEIDGKPDPMAGSMGAGDDGDPGLVTFGTSTPAGDDENGVMLSSPMIPGYTATFMVTAMNMTTASAVLQAWIDFNGNGTFETSEQLTTGSFAPNGAIVPVGGLNGAKLNFTVPANATFYQGNAMVRFRLSQNGGLSASSQTGTIPTGEIEDYKFPLVKIGNYVWEDRDFDGTQDSGEPAINGVAVALIWGGPDGNVGTTGDNVTYNTTTGPASSQQAGEYYFCGLLPGTYKLVYTSPDNMTPTRTDIGTQTNGSTVDSDGQVTGMDMSMAMETFTIACAPCQPLNENGTGDNGSVSTGTFPDLHTDETHDQGFAYLDYGDLPESGNGDNFNSTMAEVGAVHVIIPGLKLGASVDGERNGTPTADASGDDNTNTGSADDEDGIGFITPLIPGYNATISVSAMNMTGANAVLQGWIDWNNNGLLDANEALAFSNNGIVPAGGVTNAPYTFPVPSTAIFNDGMVFARFRLSPTGGLSPDGPDKYNASTTVPAGEVEDYKKNLVKVGNIVWEDYNFDGQQDATEPGIGNMPVQLIWAGADANLNTAADNVTYSTTTLTADNAVNLKGEYNFCGLIEGTYKIAITADPVYAPTLANTGDQTNGGYTDSDGLLVPAGTYPGVGGAMVMTDPIVITLAGITQQPVNEDGKGDNSPGSLGTFPNNQTNESYDFGFVTVDYGDLPNSYVTNNSGTNAGAMHIIQPGKFLGMGVDGEANGQIDATNNAGQWVSGDDYANSPIIMGMVTNGDDEDGVSLISPLVPGYPSTFRVKYTSIDVPGLTRTNKSYLSAWIDFNGNDLFEANERAIADLPLLTGTNVIRDITIQVPQSATFNGGSARARFRIHCQPGLGSAGLAVGGEVEDYYIPLAKAGNYVWLDNDLRGDEMTTNQPVNFLAEAGVNDAEMLLIWGGLDQNLTTVTDNKVYRVKTKPGTQGENQNGMYYFCGLIEGQYRVVPAKYASTLPGAGIDSLIPSNPALTIPVRKILAIANNVAGNDGKDSDGTPSITFGVPNLLASPSATLNVLGENNLGDLPTIYNFPDRLTNLSLDFGYVQQPNIELNQKIAGVEKGSVCGNFKVIVDLSIKNSGGFENGYTMAVPLANIQAEVPLKTQLGNAFVMTMGAPAIMNGKWECGEAALPQQLPVVNPGFNGFSDTKLFNGSTGLLWPGEEVVVRYVFEVRPTNIPLPESLMMMFQANGSGRAVNYQGQAIPDYFNGGAQYVATDLSDDGLEFNGTYNDPDFKTVIGPCWNSANTLAANDQINVSIAPGDCKALITDAMVLEGEPAACTDENFCLKGYFIVRILDEYGNELPNPIDISYVGRKMRVEVENIVTCLTAWGNLNLEYKQPPVITCKDVALKCTDELKNLPDPTVVSCLPYTTTYSDNTVPMHCDGQYWEVTKRTWTAEDSQGNSSFCIQNINIQRQSLTGMCARIVDYDDTDKPALNCNRNWAKDENGNPSTSVTGVPDVQGCNVICTYEDKVVDVCGNSQHIQRTWTCMDWCTNETTQCVQKIKIADKFGPVMSETGVYEYGSPEVSACYQRVRFGVPAVQDNCSEVIRMSISVAGISGEFYHKLDGKVLTDSKYYPATGYAQLPIGKHTIVYTAEDACGNISTSTGTINVIDGITPVAVSKQNVVVSLTGNGGGTGAATLYAHQVDNGSYDNCGPVKVEIRRKTGGACGNVGSDGTHNNNSTFNDNGGVTSEVPGQSWFHNPGDNKNDSDGGAFVTFCCDDIPAGENFAEHEVEIRVWDDANRNGIVGDNLIIDGVRDNYNTTWATIRVENKLAPVLTCPADATVSCDMEIFLSLDGKQTNVKDVNLSMTGAAKAYDLCSGLDVTYTDAWMSGANPVCKTGKIRRIFSAKKGDVTVTCAQIIELTAAGKAFSVSFPQRGGVSEWPSCSLSLEDVRNTSNPTIKRPITDYGQCDIVGENITIDTFLFEDGACKKWRVTYKYINWCTGQEITTINGQPIVYYYTYKDDVAPVLTCANTVVAATPNVLNPNGGCEGSVVLSATATDDLVCAEESWVKWQAFVDLWANGTTDRIASSFVNKAWNGIWARQDKFVAGQLNPNWVAVQNQHPNVVLAEIVYVTYIVPSKASGGTVTLPAFTLDAENISHRVQWRITDGCGNVDLCESTVQVVDKKAPTPYCVGVSTALMQTNPKMVELWAKDFDKGSYDNCTPQSKLYYTFRDNGNVTHPVLAKLNEEHFFKSAGQVATVAEYNGGRAYKWLPSARSAGKVFTAAGKFNIEILVWDEQLNADFCTVEMTILDNGNNGSRIAGTVSTANGQPVSEVAVTFDANLAEYPAEVKTSTSGLFNMTHPNGVDYSITASKNTDFKNGVSTLDLVMIQRHILGVETLTDPYKVIAADANNDGKVTASDLSALRKLVLGVAGNLPNNQQSWRFAVAGTKVELNPISFEEKIRVENLNRDLSGQDFVAVKIGDVNGNVSVNVANPAIEGRSTNDVVLSVAETAVKAGEVIEIPVTAKDFTDIAGYQFTMNLNGLVFEGVQSGVLAIDASNVGVIAKDVITMSYASENAVRALEGDVLFTLLVKASQDGVVSDMLSLNSTVTKAESYNSALKVGNVTLETRKNSESEIELFQNEPNPFRNTTTVRFTMPSAAKAVLTIFDVTGKVVAQRTINAMKGINAEVFTREQLGIAGVLYYTLESGDVSLTKKMIIVE